MQVGGLIRACAPLGCPEARVRESPVLRRCSARGGAWLIVSQPVFWSAVPWSELLEPWHPSFFPAMRSVRLAGLVLSIRHVMPNHEFL